MYLEKRRNRRISNDSRNRMKDLVSIKRRSMSIRKCRRKSLRRKRRLIGKGVRKKVYKRKLITKDF